MIELVNVSKKYGDKDVLNSININLDSNKFIAIKGKSGCGKTTLFNIIGLLDSSEGKIKFDGKKVASDNREKIRRNISYVFQDYLLLEYLTSYENIILPLKNLKQKIDNDYIDSLFKKFDILDLKNVTVSKLSGGERTRVSIIRALVTHPKVILADEPIGNLDVTNAKIIMNSFKELSQNNVGIIMVTHNNDYDELYDNIFEIKDKQLYEVK